MYSEQYEASKKYDYYLMVNMGGKVDCDVHFNIQSDDEDDPDWVVTEFELFFLGENVTRMVLAEAVEEKIYEQHKEVDEAIKLKQEP
jgi:hypothetical protein